MKDYIINLRRVNDEPPKRQVIHLLELAIDHNQFAHGCNHMLSMNCHVRGQKNARESLEVPST